MRNPLKARLAAGQPCVNGWLSIPSAYSAELMARAQWDSITVDLQHGVQDYASLVQCFQGVSASSPGVTLLARVAANDGGMVGKVLDAGAWGVICPMVNSAEEARAFVAACYYAPLGSRSNGPNRAQTYAEPGASYQSFANDEVLALPMIETRAAVEALEEILDVPGVSGVYVGPTDLALSYGLPPVFDDAPPEILEIYRQVIAATRARGQYAGIHCVSPDFAAQMIRLGFGFVTVGNDAGMLASAARKSVDSFRTAVNS